MDAIAPRRAPAPLVPGEFGRAAKQPVARRFIALLTAAVVSLAVGRLDRRIELKVGISLPFTKYDASAGSGTFWPGWSRRQEARVWSAWIR